MSYSDFEPLSSSASSSSFSSSSLYSVEDNIHDRLSSISSKSPSPVNDSSDTELDVLVNQKIIDKLQDFFQKNTQLFGIHYKFKGSNKSQKIETLISDIQKDISKLSCVNSMIKDFLKLCIEKKVAETFLQFQIKLEVFIEQCLNQYFNAHLPKKNIQSDIVDSIKTLVQESKNLQNGLTNADIDKMNDDEFKDFCGDFSTRIIKACVLLNAFLNQQLSDFRDFLEKKIDQKISDNTVHEIDARVYTTSHNNLFLRRMDSLAKLLSLPHDYSACVAVSVFNEQLIISSNASAKHSVQTTKKLISDKLYILRHCFNDLITRKLSIYVDEASSLSPLSQDNSLECGDVAEQIGIGSNKVWTQEFSIWVDQVVAALRQVGSIFDESVLKIAVFKLAKSTKVFFDENYQETESREIQLVNDFIPIFLSGKVDILIPQENDGVLGFYHPNSDNADAFYVFPSLTASQLLSIHAEQLMLFSYLSKVCGVDLNELELYVGISLLCCKTCYSVLEKYPNIKFKGTHSYQYGNVLDISDCDILVESDDLTPAMISSSSSIAKRSIEHVPSSGAEQSTPIKNTDHLESSNRRIKAKIVSKPSPFFTPELEEKHSSSQMSVSSKKRSSRALTFSPQKVTPETPNLFTSSISPIHLSSKHQAAEPSNADLLSPLKPLSVNLFSATKASDKAKVLSLGPNSEMVLNAECSENINPNTKAYLRFESH